MPDLGPLSSGFRIAKDYTDRLTVPDGTAIPGIVVCIPVLIPVGAASVDVDVVITEKCEVVDFTCLKRGGAGAGNTMQLKKAAVAITDAVACAVDDTLTRCATIIDTAGQNVFAVGDTLRVSHVFAAGQRQATCFVYLLIRP